MIDDVSPRVAGGRSPAKRVVDEPVTVGATVFADGHDRLHVVVSHHPPQAAGSGAKGWIDVPMASVNPGLDRWEATFTPVAVGVHRFEVQAWIDPFATWRDATRRKVDAGVDTPGDLLAGAQVLEQLADGAAEREAKALRLAAAALAGGERDAVDDDVLGAELEVLAQSALRRTEAASGDTLAVVVEPEHALFSAWYELFPRSITTPSPEGPRDSPEPPERCGTSSPASTTSPTSASTSSTCRRSTPSARRSARVPTTRPTPRPATRAAPGPSAAPAGGHTAVHPDLGTVDDLADARPPRPGRAASTWRSTWRSSARRTTPGSPSTPSGSATGPTARSSTPRTRRRSTRTSTRSTSTARPGAPCGTRCST